MTMQTRIEVAGAKPLTADIASDLAGIRALEADWRELEQKCTTASFFQSYAWCSFVSGVRAAGRSSSPEPAVVVVRCGCQPVLIWPLALVTAGSVTLAQDLTEPFSQYADALIDPQFDAAIAHDMAWSKLKSRGIDGLILRKVRADAAIHPWLSSRAKTLGEPLEAPAIDLSSFPDLASYRRTLSMKTRKNLRNLRNRLAREGKPTHALICDPGERARVVEQCFLTRADWLEAGGLSSTAFADPLFAALVRGLAEGADGAPNVTVMRLALERDDGSIDTVSLHWGFEHRGRYYTYMAAKNPAFDAFSPGRLHLEDVVTTCAGRGIATVDFLPPAMPYKTNQATGTTAVAAYGLPLTLRGRLAISGWHGYVRPAIKKAVLAAPPSLRRLIMRTAVAR